MNSPRHQTDFIPELPMIIEIKIDKTSDINSFYESIFSERYINKWGHVKKVIFRWYPQLEKKLTNIIDMEGRKKGISNYIDGLYIKHDNQLQTITQNLTSLFKNNQEKIIDGLSKTMDFNPQDIPRITILPSFKPNSTFWTEIISLSVANEVFNGSTIPYIDIFIHEITHIIWNQKIWKIYDVIWKLWPLAHEDLKEIVTPVVMRDSCFKDILQSQYMKNANEKQQLLQISIGWITHNIVDYFESIYQDMKNTWATFEGIMKEYVKIFLKIEDQIIARHTIYNNFWSSSKNKAESLKILKEKWYINPIILS